MEIKPNSKAAAQIGMIKDFLEQTGENGASLDEIESAITEKIPTRTLQRRLEQMRQTEMVSITGKGKSTRYKLIEIKYEVGNKKDQNKPPIPLSVESIKILTIVSLPELERKPVGYNRDFLELYKPNITSYLKPEETKKLFRLGKTIDQDQVAGTYAREILQRLLIDLSYN